MLLRLNATAWMQTLQSREDGGVHTACACKNVLHECRDSGLCLSMKAA